MHLGTSDPTAPAYPTAPARWPWLPRRTPGRKPVGIILVPGQGQLIALLIVAVPFLILLLIGLKTAGSGSGAGNSQDNSSYSYGNGFGAPAPFQPATGATVQDSGSTYPYQTDTVEPTESPSPTYPLGDGATQSAPTTAPGLPTSASASASSSSPAPTTTNDPAATVQAAYAAINRGDYQTAYSLGLARPGQSYANFAAGYQNTYRVDLTMVSAAGDTVTVRLLAVQKDSTEHTFSGTYTVQGGVITRSQIQQTS
jgi:hypothetical protein